MKLRITVRGRENVRDLGRLAKKLADAKWHSDAERGLIDAGRKVRSTVAKATKEQGAFRTYADVNPHVRGGSSGKLTYAITSSRGGQRLEHYKGLRISKAKETAPEAGTVRSGVWNAPRRFARSFATPAGTFRTLPGGEGSSTVAPRALWTYGAKKEQPRDDSGRFKTRGIKYAGVERLLGPSVAKELVQDDALSTFDREAPMQTKTLVEKRLGKIMKY